MKLYSEYIKEREGLEIVHDDHCFLTYKKDDEGDVIVYDIYSDKEVRGTKYMLEFCDKFYSDMRNDGVKKAYGMTDTRTKGWENSERLLLIYGFKFIGTDPKDKYVKNYYYEIGDN
tara:strand:+ start:305 stop:652 length:348 start_codon:yes stop_codon:yes gene_type:complete